VATLSCYPSTTYRPYRPLDKKSVELEIWQNNSALEAVLESRDEQYKIAQLCTCSPVSSCNQKMCRRCERRKAVKRGNHLGANFGIVSNLFKRQRLYHLVLSVLNCGVDQLPGVLRSFWSASTNLLKCVNPLASYRQVEAIPSTTGYGDSLVYPHAHFVLALPQRHNWTAENLWCQWQRETRKEGLSAHQDIDWEPARSVQGLSHYAAKAPAPVTELIAVPNLVPTLLDYRGHLRQMGLRPDVIELAFAGGIPM
jgi:hypothetical protein